MKNGFTLIELLLVIVVLGGLMVLFLPRYTQTVKKEHQTQMRALEQARELQNALNNRARLQQHQLDSLDGGNFPRKAGTNRAKTK